MTSKKELSLKTAAIFSCAIANGSGFGGAVRLVSCRDLA